MPQGPTTVQRQTLTGLLEKYRVMARMRRADEAGEVADPKAQMRALAARFPGALREIDELPMAEIEARVAAIEKALQGGEPPTWALMCGAYHGWMRTALRIKRVCRGAADLDTAVQLARAAHEAAVDEPPLDAITHDVVAAVLQPEGGRLNPVVFARVAAVFGVEPDAVRDELFGSRAGFGDRS